MKSVRECISVAVLTVGVLLVPLSGVQAVKINFEGLPFSSCVSSKFGCTPEPDSILTDDFKGVGVLFGEPGVSTGVAVISELFSPSSGAAPSSGVNSVVGLDEQGGIPGDIFAGDIFFRFVVPGTLDVPAQTDFVSFTIGDCGDIVCVPPPGIPDFDEFNIRFFDLSDTLIGSLDKVGGTARFPVVFTMPGIHQVEIDFNSSKSEGYSLDDLEFNTPVRGPTPIPEPATLLLLGSGLACLGYLHRRKKKV